MITTDLVLNIGLLLFLAIIGSEILKRYNFPVVLFYVVLGMIMSPSVLNLVNPTILQHDYLITQITLSLIAFTIGDTFLLKNLKHVGTSGSVLSILQAVFTTGIVIAGLSVFCFLFTSQAIPLASILLLGAIAAATDPASSFMVIRQFRAKGPFTSTLLAAVSIDDAVGIILFDLLVSFSIILTGQGSNSIASSIMIPLIEIVISVLVGCAFGLILAFIIQRTKKNKDSFMIITLSLVLLASGVCHCFHLSPLLCCMAMGGVFSNFSNNATQTFSSLDSFTAPVLLLFFIVSGASLDIKVLTSVGVIGIVVIVLRAIGKVYGTTLAGFLTKSPPKIAKYLGYAMLPQAGVAIGFALTVKKMFPQFDFIVTIVLANVVVSQVFGPLLAKRALFKTGEANISKDMKE